MVHKPEHRTQQGESRMTGHSTTLKQIQKKITQAQRILSEVNELYEPMRAGYTGSVNDYTGNSDQSVQIALMHTNDALMLIRHELEG
jgi:hypothetical protein